MLGINEEKTDADPSYKVHVTCKCGCGNKGDFRLNNLKNGHTTSCGCKKHETNKNLRIEMVGKRFGRLVVTREKERDEYKNKKRKTLQWYCNCDCGTKDYVVDGDRLRNGITTSCGCYQRESTSKRFLNDITGQRFGRLTVLRKCTHEEALRDDRVYWLCLCDCGSVTTVCSSSLTSGHTQSCGCLVSKVEEKIKRLLVEKGVNFKSQFCFSDLKSANGRSLKFDFAIFDNNGCMMMLIEYDGEQHFHGFRYSHDPQKNENKFNSLRVNDRLKDDYCKKNGFSLLRINYKYENDVKKLVLGALKEKGVV